jgi:hypothetical protein
VEGVEVPGEFSVHHREEGPISNLLGLHGDITTLYINKYRPERIALINALYIML